MSAPPSNYHLPPWVGLYGPAGAGKDTLAAILVESFGFTRVAFADNVREMALAIDPYIHDATTTARLSNIVREQGWEWAKRNYPDIRRLLQRIGTDAVRAMSPDFWVRLAVERASQIEGPVVFTDVRFPNEVHAVRHVRVSALVKVVRDVDPVTAHVSETALNNFTPDILVENFGTIEDLRAPATDIVRHLLKGTTPP